MAGVDLVLNGIVLGGIYAFIAMGLNLQYGFARIMNLAYGEFLMLSAFTTYTLFTVHKLNPVLSLAITVPLSFALSWLVYLVLLRRLVERSALGGNLESDSILVTFGLAFVLQNLALLQWGGRPHGYSFLATAVTIFGARLAANRLLACAVAILLGTAAYAIIRRTRLGLALRALAMDPVAANLVAIDVRLYGLLAFAAGGAMVGAAGSLVSSFLTFSPTIGIAFTMKGLIVVILGGIGSLAGSLVAGLLLGLAESLGASLLDPGLTLAINYGLFALMLLLRPRGIFSWR